MNCPDKSVSKPSEIRQNTNQNGPEDGYIIEVLLYSCQCKDPGFLVTELLQSLLFLYVIRSLVFKFTVKILFFFGDNYHFFHTLLFDSCWLIIVLTNGIWCRSMWTINVLFFFCFFLFTKLMKIFEIDMISFDELSNIRIKILRDEFTLKFLKC